MGAIIVRTGPTINGWVTARERVRSHKTIPAFVQSAKAGWTLFCFSGISYKNFFVNESHQMKAVTFLVGLKSNNLRIHFLRNDERTTNVINFLRNDAQK